ncbi:hypothetical protein SpCBS45565_g04207 [Spizellomyces sp. 'palustris']|nr:hypothetical protein SpCBS45565_g04207 [Spizellomyces sp. 'palustris']
MTRNYYCDYCDRSFTDTPAAREKHLKGTQHQRMVKLHYAAFGSYGGNVGDIGEWTPHVQPTRPLCRLPAGFLPLDKLPPSLHPPPPEGWKNRDPPVEWG